jgi:hypothetical protein
VKTTTNRVSVKQSPHLQTFYAHHPLFLTLDTGAETSMIKTSIANEFGATIQKTTQKSLQADGITQLALIREVHLTLSLNRHNLQLDVLVVDSLDVDVLAETHFMITNDISLRPSKQEVAIQGCENVYYGSRQPAGTIGSVRRTQTTVLRAPSSSTVIWPGQ